MSFSFEPNATVLIVGVGLMGQHMAATVGRSLPPKKILLVDHSPMISVGTEKVTLSDFAKTISKDSGDTVEVVGVD